MAILNNSNAISSGGYDINNSLRFRSSASAYLSRTPGSAGNRRTFTWSGWVKRGSIATSLQPLFFSEPGSNGSGFYFTQNTLQWYDFVGGTDYGNATTAVFRDPSAWYHIVLAIDTTQATASNRAKVYVNGVAQTFTQNYGDMPQNFDTSINTTSSHLIGRETSLVGTTFDGYMTEVNFIDGQALTPSSFGETDTTTGSWKPKAYTGTYGTNGFYLKFSDIATTSGSNAGLGKDFSGNANYWTTNNISVTAGSTYDAMIDSPTLTSATVANYCVLNPTRGSIVVSGNTYVNFTLSNANLTFSGAAANNAAQDTSIAVNSGKYYWEVIHTSVDNQTLSAGTYVRTNASETSVGRVSGVAYLKSGNKLVNDVSTAYGSSWTTSDVIGIALDLVNNEITYYKNNVSQGAISITVTDLCCPHLLKTNGTGTLDGSINFGQRPFSYTPPTGFVRLNTFNLPDSTIKKGNSYMEALLYTGNGTNNRTVTGVGFNPSLTWVKSRSLANSHVLADSVRGTNANLYSNLTNAETAPASSGGGGIGQVTTDGFTLVQGTSSFDNSNGNGATYVAWNWLAGTSSSSNTNGTITSTVSVNATAGFSVVTYTGNGSTATGASAATVGHGLGVAPKMIIVKTRSNVDSWPVYHTSLGAGKYIYLDLTDAAYTFDSAWSYAPSSSVFSITANGSSQTNGNGRTFVAYCWAEIAGFSKFGSYTGNGSADGPFVYTGFRPKYILAKSTGTASWFVLDTARLGYNSANNYLLPNASSAEATYNGVDILSNGFKVRNTDSGYNDSGVTYIYMAFAENPFKNSLAR
jgi:hypothetical protein